MMRSSEDVVASAGQEIWRLLWDPKVRGRVQIMKILIILFCLRSFYFLFRTNKILFSIRFSKNFNLLRTSFVARDKVPRPHNTERTGSLSYPFAWFGTAATQFHNPV